MNLVKRLSLLAAVFACVATTVSAANTLATKYFFSPELTPAPESIEIARLTQSMGFIKLSEKDVNICRFDLMTEKCAMTKYAKSGATLTPIKSEEYTGVTSGNTKLVRKGRNARNVQVQEKLARALRGTAKVSDITQIKYIDLYNACVPLWIQANSAQEVRDFIDCVKDDLIDAAIDPSTRSALLKPICVITIKNDLFLDTIDANLWSDLQYAYTMTTFANADVRKYIWSAKQALGSTLSGAKDKLDINPNFWEGLFDDLAEANYGFSFKKGARKAISEIFSVKHIVGAAVVILGGFTVLALTKKAQEAWNNRDSAVLNKEVKRIRNEARMIRIKAEAEEIVYGGNGTRPQNALDGAQDGRAGQQQLLSLVSSGMQLQM